MSGENPRRAVIAGGAVIKDYQFISAAFRENDFFIFCDSGLYHREKLGVKPDLIIGDFDSHPLPDMREEGFTEPAPYGRIIRRTFTADGTELIVLPHEKDWTDTYYAAKECIKRGFRSVLLIGASGGRPDLYFANVSILDLLESAGAETEMADECSVIRILSAGKPPLFIEEGCRYFSLLAYDGPAGGVCVKGALYPLENAGITADNPYAVSNEVLPGARAEVSLKRGKLLVITVRA